MEAVARTTTSHRVPPWTNCTVLPAPDRPGVLTPTHIDPRDSRDFVTDSAMDSAHLAMMLSVTADAASPMWQCSSQNLHT